MFPRNVKRLCQLFFVCRWKISNTNKHSKKADKLFSQQNNLHNLHIRVSQSFIRFLLSYLFCNRNFLSYSFFRKVIATGNMQKKTPPSKRTFKKRRKTFSPTKDRIIAAPMNWHLLLIISFFVSLGDLCI